MLAQQPGHQAARDFGGLIVYASDSKPTPVPSSLRFYVTPTLVAEMTVIDGPAVVLTYMADVVHAARVRRWASTSD